MSTEKKSGVRGGDSNDWTVVGERSTAALVRLGLFGLSLLLAGVMTVLFLPELLVLLAVGWTASVGAELGIHRLHVMGIAAVVAAYLLGMVVQVYRPTERVATMWGAFITIAIVTAGTLAYGVGRPEEVVPFFVLTALALLAHPAGKGILCRGASFSPALLALVAVAAVPVVAYAISQLTFTTSTMDPHAVEGHYVMMVGLVVAPLAYGTAAALGFVGWRLAAWLAALPMAYFGLLSATFPAQAGSVGLAWGAASVLWAVVFVAVTEYSRVGSASVLRREWARSS